MPDVKGFFRVLAPFLSTAITMVPGGGPVAALAAAALSGVLGKPVLPAGIAAAMTDMSGTEDGRLKLKQAEMDYQKAMTQLGYDQVEKLEGLADGDRSSARDREKTVKDKMPLILGLLAVMMLIFSIVLLAFHVFPPAAQGAILLLIGTLAGSYKDVYAYYFGSSAGSERKTELLAQAPAIPVLIKG